MKKKSIPQQGEPSKQDSPSAPGPAVRVEPGVYKIYTALLSLPQKLVSISPIENSDRSHNVYLFHDSYEDDSKWRFFPSPQHEFQYHLFNQGIPGILQAKDGNVLTAHPLQVSDGKSNVAWFFKDAGKETGIDLFYLENILTGNLATVKDHSTEDKTNIIESPYSGATSQKFILVKL
ncbi:RICIN domain-containing protein [Pseudomonas gingeri]|uniref:RICIN domain-containing protein n=1 Tax=Pseudomonas gingeri TaxID=117681 RepID=UPI0015A218B9|nr:RICIN domain-containing protein [Pseudomonas gingeri]NVZ64726.1 RICIN domain-containing protein [Pseudomonas gingeri]NVZ76448.1 RICIN domain-containing protein [Pseudomonas gingeri]